MDVVDDGDSARREPVAEVGDTWASESLNDLSELAVNICCILAAMEAYRDTPAGSQLAGQASIGLAALWIPNLPHYRRWVQKELAKCEKMG